MRFVEISPWWGRSPDSSAGLVERGRSEMKTLSPETLLIVSLGIGLVPILIAIGSCYLKFSIVLSLLRSGFGTQQAPSASLVMALSMVMSLVVMQPVIERTHAALERSQLLNDRPPTLGDLRRLGEEALFPWRDFLLAHCGERELQTFQRLAV